MVSTKPTGERKRLHITPLNSDSLPIVLSGDLAQRASHITFHTIQSSRESNYGYVELPLMDADKLKKKLNGSILKGAKMRVEDARPEKPRLKSGEDTATEDADPLREVKRQGKERANNIEGVVVGFELPEGRKVRRGWTDPTVTSKGSKISTKTEQRRSNKVNPKASKFSNGPECLFKTRLPPNAVGHTKSPTEAKLRKRKRGLSARDVVIHEFSHTKRHASFLRDTKSVSDDKGTYESLEGKDLVIENSTLIDVDPKQRSQRQSLVVRENRKESENPNNDASQEIDPNLKSPIIQLNIAQPQTIDETSSSGASSSSDSNDNTESEIRTRRVSPTVVPQTMIQDSRGVSEISSMENETNNADDVAQQAYYMSINNRPLANSNRSTAPQETPEQETSEEDSTRIHPLETLFKRPKAAASSTMRKPTLEVSTSFSFFDQDTEETTNASLLLPQTPFTQQDFRERRQRSAAPTPDTAAPGKTFGDVWVGDQDHIENEDENQDKLSSANRKTGEGVPESDFSKWFWENRGETNRSWKRRRREAAKGKRQRGNRRE